MAWPLQSGGLRRHSMGQRGIRGQRYGPPKKDRQGVQSVRQEIGDEIRGGSAAPVLQGDRNRDIARGDWDRTNRRHDEGVSREDQVDQAERRPEARYPERTLRRRETIRNSERGGRN
jgi:hypothetical protein